jgi:hypothetical protein
MLGPDVLGGDLRCGDEHSTGELVQVGDLFVGAYVESHEGFDALDGI